MSVRSPVRLLSKCVPSKRLASKRVGAASGGPAPAVGDTLETNATVAPLICNHIVIRKATRQLGQLFDAVMDGTDLKATQCGLLMQIEAMRSPTMKDLAKALVMDLSALGHTLKPLIRDGFVVLVPDSSDRRSKRVALTGGGGDKLVEIKQLWREATMRFETALGVERAQELRATLSVVASDAFGEAFRAATPKRGDGVT